MGQRCTVPSNLVLSTRGRLPAPRRSSRRGVRRVFYVARDSDPRIGVGAAEILRSEGIEVIRLADPGGAVSDLLAPFRCRVATARPLLTAKYAMTLDGRIAASGGDSRWVTGPTARHQVHLLRDRVDAILIGVGTLLADDPELTTRLADHWRPVRHPLRVIVDSHGRSPLTARLFDQSMPGTTLVATVDAPAAWSDALAARGVEVERLSADPVGRVDLRALLASLAARGVNHLLAEGGSELLGTLGDARLIDQINAWIAPKLVGGRAAPGPLAGGGVTLMAEAGRYHLRRVERHDDDVLLVATAVEAPWWSESDR